MAMYVISERNANNHVAWGTIYEFEDIIARTCDAQIVAPPRMHLPKRALDIAFRPFLSFRYLQPKNFQFANEPNVLLLIGMGPRTLRMLDKLGSWRSKCDVVAAYIVDLYPMALKRLDKKVLRRLDHLFISYEQMLEPVKKHFGVPVSLIPQACDVLRHGSFGGNRPIDIIGYGR